MANLIDKYDLIILGVGAAGLSAAIYAARYDLKVLVLGKEIGGMMNLASLIENYPGFIGSGIELTKKMAEQAKDSGAEILQKTISNIRKDTKAREFQVQTDKNEIFKARAMIIALGTEKRKLNIEGEDKFLGKGVSYCATCDAPLFKSKIVVVIGGRNSAAHSALLLAQYAKKVYIVYRQEKLNCDAFLVREIKKNKKIEVVYNSVPVKIYGKDVVENLVINQKDKGKKLEVDGIFVEIGSVPVTSLAKNLGLKLDKNSYIIADSEMKTDIAGVFAAGDITTGSLKQIVSSAGQGATAALSAYKFLKDRK